VLAIDDASAEVVRRIFAEYLDGRGDRAIAGGLNRDGVPCPSARRPDQNRHRLADGWQASTVRAILDNPRCTGYAFFGRWTKHETLLDPGDVAAGHVVRRPNVLVRDPSHRDEGRRLLAATPMSGGTRDQIRARLDEAASRGVTEIVFQPCGPDIRTELERFFDAATS
jgi:Recombinase